MPRAENPYHTTTVSAVLPRPRPSVFLSLPYRAHTAGKQTAYEESLRACAAFKKAGIAVYNPLHWHQVCHSDPALDPDDDSWFAMNEPFLRSAAAMCIIQLSGYRDSVGIKHEQRIAGECGIPVWSAMLGDVPRDLVMQIAALERGNARGGSITRDSPIRDSHIAETASEICLRAAELLDGDRASEYGDKLANHTNIAALWREYLRGRAGESINAMDASVMMALMKIARLKLGKRALDCFVDGAAYIAMGGEIAARLGEDQ